MIRPFYRALVLVAVVFVVAACGDDNESGPGSSTTAATAASTTTSTTTSGATTSTSSAGEASGAPAQAYDCGDLMTDAELQLAIGISSASLFSQELWTDTPGTPEGQTYCQYFANDGAISIAVSILTGESFDVLFVPLVDAGASIAEPLSGIGDMAVVAPDGTGGAARAHGVGITVFITDLSGSGFGTLDVKEATTNILELVAGRV
jgi:hypothetical protein